MAESKPQPSTSTPTPTTVTISDHQPTLDTFISSSNPIKTPTPIYITQHINDRNSYFKAAIFKLTNSSQLQTLIKFSKTHQYHQSLLQTHPQKSPVFNHPPTHNIKAWRFLSLNPPSSSNASHEAKDYSIQSGYDDDGERWAGRKVLNIMESQATIDGLIIVSRWYGGTMLGPIRFQHIESVSMEACKSFGLIDEISDKKLLLNRVELDIKQLREELNDIRNKKAPLTDDNQRKRKKDQIVLSDNHCVNNGPDQIVLSDNHCVNNGPDQSTPSLYSDLADQLNSSESVQSDNFDQVKLQNDLDHLNKLLFSKQKSLNFLKNSLSSLDSSIKTAKKAKS